MKARLVYCGRSHPFIPDSYDEELLDWDVYIQDSPGKNDSGSFKARFKYLGRSTPLDFDEGDYYLD